MTEPEPAWAAIDRQRRARVLFKFKTLIEEHKQELAHLMSSEHGKLLDDSKGELQRGLDVVEFVCGIPHLQKGEFIETTSMGPIRQDSIFFVDSGIHTCGITASVHPV